MKVHIDKATEADAAELALLRTQVADDLTRRQGRGHWSSRIAEASVVRAIVNGHVLAARAGEGIVATLWLSTRKPWAIDLRYFTDVDRALYLHGMAVAPGYQRRGVGRCLVQHAIDLAAAWPVDAVRLDAYDHPAGAGGFYSRCGFEPVGRATYRGVALIYFERLVAGAGIPTVQQRDATGSPATKRWLPTPARDEAST